MIVITMTDENFEKLNEELDSLWSYHWRDENIHADDCGSKVSYQVTHIAGNFEDIHFKIWDFLRELK